MKEFANAFGLGVQWVCLTGLAAFAIWFILHASFIGHSILWRHLRSLRLPDCLLALLAIGYCTHIGAVKTNGQNNARQQMMMSTRTMAPSSGTNGLLRVENWHRRGAWEDSIPFEFDSGWTFPCGSGRLAGVEIFSCGEIRPDARSTNVVARLPVPLAQVPFDTEFRCGRTASNSYAFEWIGGHPDRLADETMDGRIELFRNGDWSVATNGVATYSERVEPMSWSGLPRSATAELPEGAYTNAYYWIDLVSPCESAEILFTGVGSSNLPDPHFVAEEGVTNRVWLLIGKEYTVTGSADFEIVATSDSRVEVERHGDRLFAPRLLAFPSPSASSCNSVRIAWPAVIEAEATGGNGFTMSISPHQMGGVFNWNAKLCCMVVGNGNSYEYVANESCDCAGCCAQGTYRYEGFELEVSAPVCPCFERYVRSPRVELNFDHAVMLIEQAYTNSYGVAVAPQSTVNWLRISLYGGENGGSFSVSVTAGGKISRVAGDELPANGNINQYETKEFYIEYIADEMSQSAGDVFVVANLAENNTGHIFSDRSSVTVVAVSTLARGVSNVHRKELGVGEKVLIVIEPEELDLPISISKCSYESLQWIYRAPAISCSDVISVACGDASLPIVFSILQPESIVATSCHAYDILNTKGAAGGIYGLFDLCVLPTNVSFSSVEVMEVGCVATNAVGYFTKPNLSGLLDHSLHGGGVWHGLRTGNVFYDHASITAVSPPWDDGGSFTYPIPNAWRIKGDVATTNIFPHQESYDQKFELDSDGTVRITKFTYTLQRTTNGVFTVGRE